jgi:hypothetical protein
MDEKQVTQLFFYIESIVRLLDNLPKQACILIPASKGLPYKYEEISVYAIVSTPEIYKKKNNYILRIDLSNGTSREIISPSKEALQVLNKEIREWRNLL